MTDTIYEITVLNWEKHNPRRKKGYQYTLIKNNFCDDATVRSLPVSVRWLYLYLILCCGSNNEKYVRSTREMLEKGVRSTIDVVKGLELLQLNQLVTIEKKHSFNKIREEKRIEAKASSTELESSVESDLAHQKKPVDLKPEKVLKVSQPGDLQNISRIQDLVALIPDHTRKNWRELYAGDEEFVKRQLIRCWQYYAIDKPHRRPRKINGWSRAINTWLEKEWIKHSRTVGAPRVRPGQ